MRRLGRRAWAWIAAGLVVSATALCWAASRFDWLEDVPVSDPKPFRFSSGFEGAETWRDLCPPDGSGWHGFQKDPGTNTVAPSGERTHSGAKSLKCVAAPKDGSSVPKADIHVTGLRFVQGDHVWSRAWFWLVGGTDATHVFLWDLEASTKFHSPGRRLYLQTGESLSSDLGKWWGSETFRQERGKEIRFPKDRWVRVDIHMLLSADDDGRMEVWQDEVKVLDATGQTLPTSKTVYDRLQVGLTANGNREHAQTLYVDDVLLSNRPLD